MRKVLAVVVLLFGLLATLALPLAAFADVPVHLVQTVTVAAAGWKNAEVVASTALMPEGQVIAWAIRANTGCTSAAYVPYLVDKRATSGTGTPSAAPPAEYRVAEESSMAVVASATEPSSSRQFTTGMPYDKGLSLWLNVAGGTTCTFILSVWILQ